MRGVDTRNAAAEKMEDFLVNRARTRDFCPRTNYSITGLITRKRSLFEQRGEGGTYHLGDILDYLRLA